MRTYSWTIHGMQHDQDEGSYVHERDAQQVIDDLLRPLRMFIALDPRCQHGVGHCGECAVCLGNAAIALAEKGGAP